MAIRIKLLYFGQARDASGRGEELVTLPDRSSVEELVKETSSLHPGIGKMTGSMQIAVNEEIAGLGKLLQNGDEVAFLPPVSGG